MIVLVCCSTKINSAKSLVCKSWYRLVLRLHPDHGYFVPLNNVPAVVHGPELGIVKEAQTDDCRLRTSRSRFSDILRNPHRVSNWPLIGNEMQRLVDSIVVIRGYVHGEDEAQYRWYVRFQITNLGTRGQKLRHKHDTLFALPPSMVSKIVQYVRAGENPHYDYANRHFIETYPPSLRSLDARFTFVYGVKLSWRSSV